MIGKIEVKIFNLKNLKDMISSDLIKRNTRSSNQNLSVKQL